jgi:hypothetical protein
MRHIVDPRQNRLFDPFHGLFGSQALRLLAGGWQGVFRHVVLELMPVIEVSAHFHPTLGTRTKELYSMAGLVFLADFQDWTAAEAAEAYMFRTDVQYALNLEPGAELSSRTVERYQRLFREDELAGDVFEAVTRTLAGKLELDVSKQRLDSTHLFSHMATFGRTKLMAVAVKRFLTQVKRHAPDDYAALPEDFRRRYEPSQAQLFSGAKDADSRQRSRQQAAEDLLWVIERFADRPGLAGRSTYKALVTIFHEQCEVVEGKVAVRKKTGGDVTQNPSDPDATYDGHKGPGYQVQIAETCSDANDVQLITGALPQTACEYDGDALVPVLEQLERSGLLPEEMMADTHYGSDENVQAAEGRGVELVAPVPGREPASKAADALSIDDFAIDERTGNVEACPAGHAPLSVEQETVSHDDGTTTRMTRVEMPAAACAGCPFFEQCPVDRTRDDRYSASFTDKQQRTAARRREQETDVFQDRYAKRSGIESTNSGVKNRLGLGRLRVRGRGAVFRAVLLKLAGWNVLRAAASGKLRAWIATQMARALGGSGPAQSGQASGQFARFVNRVRNAFCPNIGRPGRLATHCSV